MNYIDGRFVPIAGSTKRNVPLNNQLEAPHSKEVGLDQDGQHDFTADATKGCAQEKIKLLSSHVELTAQMQILMHRLELRTPKS